MEQLSQRTVPDQRGSSLARVTVCNADVVWLENWFPTTFLSPGNRLEMTFGHAWVLDIRARARTLQHLLNWEDEGAVVERWIENCAKFREPPRLAPGRYLKEHWCVL